MLIKVPMSSGDFGQAILRVAEYVMPEIQVKITSHSTGEAPLWPEDEGMCMEKYHDLEDYLEVIKDEAAFLLSAFTYTDGMELSSTPLLTELVRDIMLIGWMDEEKKLGLDNPIGKALSTIIMNPILHYPDRGARVNH